MNENLHIFDFLSEGTKLRGLHQTVLNPRATVICLTGDGTSGTQSSTWPSLITSLNAINIDVCAFDFNSQGLSEGKRSELTLGLGKKNFLDFLEFEEKQGLIKTQTIYCLGSSFGAAVLLQSSEVFNRFQKISLKSPAFELAKAYEQEIGGVSSLRAWKDAEIHPELGLPFKAYSEASISNGYLGLMELSCPTLITIGDQDEIVGLESCVRAQALRPDIIQLEVLPGVFHNYKQNGAKDRFEELNCSFFGAE